MEKELEEAMEAALERATAKLGDADEAVAQAEAEAEKIMVAAREKRAAIISDSVQVRREVREEVIRTEKALKAIRGEPLNPPRRRARQNGGSFSPLLTGPKSDALGVPPEDKIKKVYDGAKAIAAESEDEGFTVSSVDQALVGISYMGAKKAIAELRRRENVRLAGRGRRGPNKVEIFKLTNKPYDPKDRRDPNEGSSS